MKVLFLGFLLLGSMAGFANDPDSIICKVSLHTSPLLGQSIPDPQKPYPTVKELYDTEKEEKFLEAVVIPVSGKGEVSMHKNKLKALYSFNSENGHIEIYDEVNMISARMSWTNDYENINTGYLRLTTDLNLYRGNLIGIPNAFGLTFRCYR
ncbi:MAG: hypothetical protein A2381_05800 [Bdellovibrionales bacterium RIFOXYB1_FULL_37_110]|nr:MAG: hypothetical protein A2417_04685 [Bdellovibrionales bacterium RIFOXYC1_FULL_37_79]OFZ59335.1 MAG: hypothetical protein A2381_05800 [Bdellovibrionales bacterium RIFOXYB1_FULL_37_110]OFZ61895.1 MAG: hypothetical protein A2577_17685 [Bdellovibrionales bacterium RIFOXYD1_FULL_36_51]